MRLIKIKIKQDNNNLIINNKTNSLKLLNHLGNYLLLIIMPTQTKKTKKRM